MNKFILSLAVVLLAAFGAKAQEHEHETQEHVAEHGKHKLAIYTGFTHVEGAFYEHETHEESTGKWIPTLGVDYFYSLNHKWELGLMVDMEFDNYMIRLEDETEEERLNVLVSSIVGKYKITHHLSVFAGPGIETEFSESTKTFFVAKLGAEYEIEIAKGWEIAPSIMYDWKEEYQSFAYGFSIGKRF